MSELIMAAIAALEDVPLESPLYPHTDTLSKQLRDLLDKPTRFDLIAVLIQEERERCARATLAQYAYWKNSDTRGIEDFAIGAMAASANIVAAIYQCNVHTTDPNYPKEKTTP